MSVLPGREGETGTSYQLTGEDRELFFYLLLLRSVQLKIIILPKWGVLE